MTEELTDVPLDKILVQKHNVRVHGIDREIEGLAENIRANGLLQPVTAYFDPEKKRYVILAGQRRLNAYDYLHKKYPDGGFDRIQCKVTDEPKTDVRKRALSLAENITQLPMTHPDLILAVTDLYNISGNYEAVQREFGITRYMVDKYVRLARLPDELKGAVRDGGIHPNPKTAENMAVRAVDATRYVKNGEVPIDKVIEIAREMSRGEASPADIASEATRGGTVPEMVERAKKRTKTRLNIDLSREMAGRLEKISGSNGETTKVRATQYIMDGIDRDYSDLEGDG